MWRQRNLSISIRWKYLQLDWYYPWGSRNSEFFVFIIIFILKYFLKGSELFIKRLTLLIVKITGLSSVSKMFECIIYKKFLVRVVVLFLSLNMALCFKDILQLICSVWTQKLYPLLKKTLKSVVYTDFSKAFTQLIKKVMLSWFSFWFNQIAVFLFK